MGDALPKGNDIVIGLRIGRLAGASVNRWHSSVHLVCDPIDYATRPQASAAILARFPCHVSTI